jgi:hypothetical protein
MIIHWGNKRPLHICVGVKSGSDAAGQFRSLHIYIYIVVLSTLHDIYIYIYMAVSHLLLFLTTIASEIQKYCKLQ